MSDLIKRLEESRECLTQLVKDSLKNLNGKTQIYSVSPKEIDGKVHDRRVSQTESRNQLYKEAGIKLIVLSLSNIKERRKTVEEYLDWKMMKLGL